MSAAQWPSRIAILGGGKIGRAVGELWLRAGHSVVFRVRSPAKAKASLAALGPGARAITLEAAAADADLALLAVPYEAVEEVAAVAGEALAGKLVLDATNPFGLSPSGRIISTLGPTITAGSRMAERLPASTIVRAFSHVMEELLVSRGTTQPGLWAMAIAGDEPSPKAVAAEVVRDAGFVPVDIGTLAESAPLDPGGALFPHLFTEADMRLLVGS